MSNTTPQSTTAGLAGNVPKENVRAGSSDLPGSFPETPAQEASEFSVNPIPASSGTGNPVQTKPGEKVPDSSSFNPNTINSTVTTDKASYENSSGTPQLPGGVNSADEGEKKGGMFSLQDRTNNMIPESSLPMGGAASSEKDPGYTIQSSGPNSTTAGLAGNVPLEPRGVPEVVTESQQEAGFQPEAASNREAVREKSDMEKELESKVPEEPSTSEGTGGPHGGHTDKKDLSDGEIAGMAAGGAGATAAVAAAAGYATKGGQSSQSGLPSSVQQSIDQMNSSAQPISPTVPDTVQESITKAHWSPEAAGDKEMVSEKAAMESELLKKTPTETMGGEPAPSSSAALTDTAPAATNSATKGSSDLAAPASAPAQTPAAQNAVDQKAGLSTPDANDSRDVSPMTRRPGDKSTAGQSIPAVTTGVGSSKAAEVSSPASASSGGMDKKEKRKSGFFGKLKSKLGGHKDEK